MLSASLAVLLTAAAADPTPPAPNPEPVHRAVERGLTFLEQSGMAWMKERKCASCHAVPLTLWSHYEAQRHGFAMHRQAIDELRDKALAEYVNHPELKPAPQEGKPKTLSVAPLYLAQAAPAAGLPDPATTKALDRFARHLAEVQQADGSWGDANGGPKATNSPVKDTNDVLTMYALLGVGSREPAVRDRALAWLQKATPGGSNQALVLRVLTRHRFGKAEEVRSLVKQLLAQQHPDGGWGQLPDAPSDAVATGQALYALGTVGTPADDPAVQKARKFLVGTQHEDGSWLVHTRVKGGHDVIISHFGSGWAVLGLVSTLPTTTTNSPTSSPSK
jgi:hypothetical protein